MQFKLVTDYKPTGDQPQAIEQIVKNLNDNVSDQVLLGITGSGKSILSNESILIGIKRNGEIQPTHVSIGTFIDEILKENPVTITQDKNEIVWSEQIAERYFAYSINPKNNQTDWKPIKSFIRHPAPKTLYRIITTCGRRITVTGDHNFFVMRQGELKLVTTDKITLDDYLPLPKSLPTPQFPLESVSVGETIKNEKVYAHVPTHFLNQLDLSYQKKWRVVNKKENVLLASIPDDLLQNLLLKGKKHSFPSTLKLTNEWLSLFGIYVAEGHFSHRYILISAQQKEWHQHVKEILTKLNLKFGVRKNGDLQVTFSILNRVFANWCGKTSFEKKLPPFWMRLNNYQLAKMLSAYFSGDGGVEAEGVFCSTVSKKLADDLLWALMRFGIWARIRFRKFKKPSGQPTFCWTISITGRENLEKFTDSIGFDYKTKQNQLRNLMLNLEKTSVNTNVDIIPITGKQIKSLRAKLGICQRELADILDVSQALISMYENNHRKPSRQVWQRFISYLEFSEKASNSKLIEEAESYLNCHWTKVNKIKKIKSVDKYVYDISVEEWETFLGGFGGLFVHNTFSIACVIQEVQRPTLVIAHNKTLAAQLYQEFKTFFPENAVEYFVSYYDYYQPEAYVPAADLYIEKEATINEEIDRLRLSTTCSLFERRDVIVVASVSCIYGLGDPDNYFGLSLQIEPNQELKREELLKKLVAIQYERAEFDFERGKFRVRGDIVEVYPSYQDEAYRIEFWGDEIDGIYTIDPLLGEVLKKHDSQVSIYPKTHFATPKNMVKRAVKTIKEELVWWEEELIKQGKLVESQRLHQRTMYDLEMMKEMGFCRGIENYSRHITGKKPGEPPPTLLHYLPKDTMIVIDESHQTVSQIGAMYKGDQSRKGNLVEYGFRLPSAKDNRPLNFQEFESMIPQTIYVSATPGNYELEKTEGEVIEQIIRPTGLLDPKIEVRPVKGQIDNLLEECRKRAERNERVLVTTLTKKMSENLTEYFAEVGVKVNYLHSDIDTLERIKILRDLRRGEFDVLVGINLLREGLDLPEVSLVAILDADKEGFLRSEKSLIQTIGRAARHAEGKAILYADKITKSMKVAIDETKRRRKIQEKYNEKHGITPTTIVKSIDATLVTAYEADYFKVPLELDKYDEYSPKQLKEMVANLETEMRQAAKNMKFEQAAEIRDKVKYLKERQIELS